MTRLVSALIVGVALLLPAQASAGVDLGPAGRQQHYVVGLVSNADLPGPSGESIITVYLSVAGDDGVGTLSDPVHPGINSHLAVRRSLRKGNRLQFDGEIIRSNDPARAGQQVSVFATVHGDHAFPLEVVLNDEVFSGQGRMLTKFVSFMSRIRSRERDPAASAGRRRSRQRGGGGGAAAGAASQLADRLDPERAGTRRGRLSARLGAVPARRRQ